MQNLCIRIRIKIATRLNLVWPTNATFNGRNKGKVTEYILFRSGGLVQLTDGDDDDGQMDQYSKFCNLWYCNF